MRNYFQCGGGRTHLIASAPGDENPGYATVTDVRETSPDMAIYRRDSTPLHRRRVHCVPCRSMLNCTDSLADDALISQALDYCALIHSADNRYGCLRCHPPPGRPAGSLVHRRHSPRLHQTYCITSSRTLLSVHERQRGTLKMLKRKMLDW